MNRLVVLKPGLLTSVQDLGRPGLGPQGISSAGAADPLSLRLANLLVGNPEGSPALEFTLIGGTFQFPDGAVFSIVGADLGAELDGRPVELGVPHAAPPGATLRLGQSRDLARSYLAIAGGVQVPLFLGSASTDLTGRFGGYSGRALRAGDVLSIGLPSTRLPRRRLSAVASAVRQPRKTLRIVRGPQFDWFAADARQALLRNEFLLTEESNRMGLRLSGPPLPLVTPRELISEGVSLGSLQVTSSGQPILLFVEQQTAGGYPKIATVISADAWCIGQLRPRDVIRFTEVSLEEARELYLAHEAHFAAPERLFA